MQPVRVNASKRRAPRLQAVVLAALLGLSAPALARHAEGSENAAALEALVADPQLVISRESLIASMTDPETRPSDAASSSAGDTSHSGVPAQDTDQDQQARAGASPKAGSEPRNRPLPVETALTIASAVLGGPCRHQGNASKPAASTAAAAAARTAAAAKGSLCGRPHT